MNATTLALDNSFVRALPEMSVPWRADAAPETRLLVLNDVLARELGLDPAWLRGPEGRTLLVGNGAPAGSTPVALAYAGHQFGGFVPSLGDGRALLLGEFVDDGGRRDLHLKGSGRTPFARGGDGLAAVGPMLREYLISEAMHGLGIPTTRALAVVATGRQVWREAGLPAAVLARVASSHLRVGSFQYAARAGSPAGDTGVLRRLADYAIGRHYPAAAAAEQPYLAFYDEVVAAQSTLVAQWMLVGFIHGVMNTDNMTVSGETIDYGPCAFMNVYDPATVYSSIDHGGRYAYQNQPVVAEWNLARLAEALLPLFADDPTVAIDLAERSLSAFGPRYDAAWSAGAQRKIGLPEPIRVPTSLIADLLVLLGENRVDFTAFFRHLGTAARGDAGPARAMFVDRAGFDSWLARWLVLKPNAEIMDRVNPIYIARNHLVEEALASATRGDLDLFAQLLAAVSAPYDERPGLADYAKAAPADFGTYQTFCGT